MAEMADVAVIGGGPAGLATAIGARLAGLSVIVLDRRQPPVEKACGEGLMPDAAEGPAGGLDAQGREAARGVGHEALAAGLVERRAAAVEDSGGEAGQPRLDRRREPRRPAADDGDVDRLAHSVPSSSASSSASAARPASDSRA